MYIPQRYLRQMGYDQGAISITRDSRTRLACDTEARFIVRGQDMI